MFTPHCKQACGGMGAAWPPTGPSASYEVWLQIAPCDTILGKELPWRLALLRGGRLHCVLAGWGLHPGRALRGSGRGGATRGAGRQALQAEPEGPLAERLAEQPRVPQPLDRRPGGAERVAAAATTVCFSSGGVSSAGSGGQINRGAAQERHEAQSQGCSELHAEACAQDSDVDEQVAAQAATISRKAMLTVLRRRTVNIACLSQKSALAAPLLLSSLSPERPHFRVLSELMPESERLDGCMAEPFCRPVLGC